MRKPMIIAGLATAVTLVAGGGVAIAARQDPTPAGSSPTAPSSPATTSPSTAATPGDDDRDDRNDAREDGPNSTATPAVSRDQAERTALGKVPGGRVGEAELDTENGKPVWEIDVDGTDRVEHEFTIDALDGTILKSESDTPGADDADDADDTDDTDDTDEVNDTD